MLLKKVIHSKISNGSQCKGAPPICYRQTVIKANRSFRLIITNGWNLLKIGINGAV